MVEPGFQLRGDKIKIVLKELSIFFSNNYVLLMETTN